VPADFVNSSGSALRITGIELPTFAQCFPDGVGNLLPPGQPDPDPPASCGVGQTLPNGAICRVDVDSICRDLAAASQATIDVAPADLNLTANGPARDLTVTNSVASPVAAANVSATVPGGSNISVQSTTCGAGLAVGASCTLSLVGSAAEGPTTVIVAGDNTNTVNVDVSVLSGSTLTAISPNSGPAAGGTGVTLTGTGLTGATVVTFDGVAATSVNVVNSTTVTAVTPAHAAGTVDVVIDTPAGGAILTEGFTYVATAVGQSAGGGTIACLNGGLNNLIAATADNSTGIEWGGFGTAIGSGAQSVTDGAANTATIVNAVGAGTYAAYLCATYEVDSQGNIPCQAGNACYDDWFLPAGNNLTTTGQLNCLFANRAAIGGFAAGFYWSSTEFSGDPVAQAWMQDFNGGSQFIGSKSFAHRVRCVRGFTP
jgi:hypothetical protein